MTKNNSITVTDPVMLRKLGFEYPIPSYVAAVPKLLLSWLSETNPEMSTGEKYELIGKMYRYDQEEQIKSHTIEHRVAHQIDEYSMICHLVDTVEERHASYIDEWSKDPEFKAALHAHDHIFK